MPMPSQRPISPSSSRASGSPSRAASVTSGPVRSSGCPPTRSNRSETTGLPADIRARASRTRALPEAYCSQQPRLPHSQRMPSGTTCMWPNSPAMPKRPRMTRPSRTMPPPMPVPRLTMTRWLSPRPAPKRYSAHTAALASLSTKIGRSHAPAEGGPQRLVAPGQVRGEDDGGAVGGDEPGRADADGGDRRRRPRGAPRRRRRSCPRRRAGSSSGAGCRGGPGAGRCRGRRRRRRRPWSRRCRCRSRAGRQPRGSSCGSSASRTGMGRARPARSASGAVVRGCVRTGGGRGGAARAREVGEDGRGHPGEVGEARERLGAQRADDGRGAAQRAPLAERVGAAGGGATVGGRGRASPRGASVACRRVGGVGGSGSRRSASATGRVGGRGGLGRGPAQALEQARGLVGDRADLLVPALSAHWPTAPRRARTARAALRCPPQHSGRRSAAAPTAG